MQFLVGAARVGGAGRMVGGGLRGLVGCLGRERGSFSEKDSKKLT